MENYRCHRPGSGSDNATWTLTGLEPGYYEMHATWTRASGRAGNAPYKVYDGVVDPANLELQADVNQKKRPNQAFYDGSMWNLLRSADGVATVYVDSGTLTVELGHDTDSQGNPVDGKVVADAIWAKKLPGVPAGVMDNEYLGYVESGTGWWTSTWNLPGRQGPYQENYRIHVGGGDGSNTATWTLESLANGTYDVYATWTSATGRATNAPYRVFDGTASGGTLRLDVAMNQRLEANDAAYDGHGWELLGLAQITTGTLTVQLSDNADGKVIADAIWAQIPAGGGAAASSGGSVAVARTDLQPTVTTATDAWPGLDSAGERVDQVEAAESAILDLPDLHLGMASLNAAYPGLDVTEDGRLVDPISDGNEEFKPPGFDGGLDSIAPEAVDRIDLSTVVSCEPRHLVRVEDLDSLLLGLVSDPWSNHERREAKESETDAIFANDKLLASIFTDD